MPDANKRLSLLGLNLSRKGSSRNIAQRQLATLDFVIESPPLVFYGSAASSTGALLSGQVQLNIQNEHMAIETIEMRLALEVTRKKPFRSYCQDCSHQTTDLMAWNFLRGPATLGKGELNCITGTLKNLLTIE
jgi:arrestin-related trafficking adapter 1